jgi:hypothetical protein
MSNETMENVAENTEVTTVKTTLTCPHCNNEFVIETPAPQRRGQLQGLAIEEMTDEQLKVEIVNAKSVLYKAQKRGASADTIAKNQARVDAAMAEKAKRAPAVETKTEEAPVAENETVYSEETASEI